MVWPWEAFYKMIKSLFVVLAVFAFLWTPHARTAEPATVSGKWHFVFDTEGGDREFDSVLVQSSDKVTGKWAVTETKKDGDAVAGTFSEDQLALEFPINSEEAGPGTLKIIGKLADDGTLSGNWSFTDYSGTFKANRVKEQASR
jgi:hypothetical protein